MRLALPNPSHSQQITESNPPLSLRLGRQSYPREAFDSKATLMKDLPDAVLLVAALLGICAVHRLLTDALRGWERRLQSRTQTDLENFVLLFDAGQRALNLLAQSVQLIFNLFVIFFDTETRRDPLRAYSECAHFGFVLVAAFYLYDTFLWMVHPKVKHRFGWVMHHVITILLLSMNFQMRKGAFAASCFLISSAGHISNELRWFWYKLGKHTHAMVNILNVTGNLVIFWSCLAAPLYMIHVIALSTETPWRHLFSSVMRWPCLAGISTIYIPHVVLFFVQVHRTLREWQRAPCSRNELKSKSS
ncbi:hypothetical protein FVE85_2071 [Porphyridium purpureum]|uniref:TLC domain-containing protein n=1 Tax=Porphyridium purpureum TaxID=35688 RepID=A0A5J4YX49_PORPP|nr:hypothetical protein FVE85_2071 [Porphyridium purpureum]|eukprot:POR3827..scf209_3